MGSRVLFGGLGMEITPGSDARMCLNIVNIYVFVGFHFFELFMNFASPGLHFRVFWKRFCVIWSTRLSPWSCIPEGPRSLERAGRHDFPQQVSSTMNCIEGDS